MATQPAPVSAAEAAPAPFSASEAVARMSEAAEATAAESPSPAPVEAAPEEQAEVASPATEQPSPAPTTEPTQDAQKWLLDKFGGDLNKAAQWAVENNNRNAQFAAALKANGIDPNTLTRIAQAPQAPPVDLPVPQEAPVQIPEEQVIQTVKQYLSNDTEAVRLARAFDQNTQRIGQIESTAQDVQQKLNTELLRLTIPEVAQDAFRASEVKETIRDLKTQLMDLKAERRDLFQEQKDVERQHKSIGDWYKGKVTERLTQAETQRLDQARYEQATTYHEQQFAQAWPTALDSAIKDHKIPAELVDDFKAEARTYARAVVNADGEPGYIEDPGSFVANVAKSFMDRADKYHRIQSGKYGALATARAAVPGPAGSAAVAPPTNNPVPETVQDISRSALARLRENWRGLTGA